MTVTYPYDLASFANRLAIETVVWSIQRNDELSGMGSGAVFQAELSIPLWLATVEFAEVYHNEAKQIAALIRKLHGAQESFRLFDPLSRYPQSDPEGLALGSNAVQVESIPSHRASLSFIGLPPGYLLLPGDKFTIAYGSNPTRIGFFEISEAASAGSDGSTNLIGVFPHLPPGIGAGAAVILKDPFCEMKIMPGTHNPGTASRLTTIGGGFKAIQKR